MVEMAGVDDTLADRLAAENPLLACRVARLRRARGQADAGRAGMLLQALAAGRDLPLLAEPGIQLFHHERFTGAVLAGDHHGTVDQAQFDTLIRYHPAVMVPADTGSLQLAVQLWAAALTPATALVLGRPLNLHVRVLRSHCGRLSEEPRSRRSNRPHGIGAVAVLSVST